MINRFAASATARWTGWMQRRCLALLATLILTAGILSGADPAMAARTNGGPAGGVTPTPLAPAPANIPAQFDIVGFMQEATVDGSICPAVTDPRLFGGTVVMNGQKITVPCNTILQMPAFTLTWAELVSLAPPDIVAPGTTGLALTDPMLPGAVGLLNTPWALSTASTFTSYNAPLPSVEIHIQGNVIPDKVNSAVNQAQYIAGLVFISQQSLNAGSGAISCIDYATGEIQVGGVLQQPGAPCPDPSALPPGVARLHINDPAGVYGGIHGGPGCTGATPSCDFEEPGYDVRFSVDTENPTIFSTLGVPVCVPVFNPFTQGTDTLCPQSNRPAVPNCSNYDPALGIGTLPAPAAGDVFCKAFLMDAPGAVPVAPGSLAQRPGQKTCLTASANPAAPAVPCTDPTVAVPLEIGDTINYAGTLKADAKGPYVSAHTISANLGIYTQPHTMPSYIAMEEVLVGTGGNPVGGLAQEVTSKVSWVGFSSDPTELVDFYSLAADPVSGAISERLLGTQDPCCNPLGRFRAPANNNGAFGEPTRYYRAVSRTACQTPGATTQFAQTCHLEGTTAGGVLANPTPTKNGLIPGRYLLPNFDFIFAENLNFGTPLVPNNFQDLPFLYCGSGPIDGPGSGTTVVGQLDPAPWAPPMADPIFRTTINGCNLVKRVDGTGGVVVTLPPIAVAVATPASVASGQTVTLSAGTSSDPNTPPLAITSISWLQTGGPALAPPLANVASPSFTAPTVAATTTLTFQVTVRNSANLSSTASVTVTVNPPAAVPPTVLILAPSTVPAGSVVNVLATTNGTTFSWIQTAGPVVTLSNATTLTPSFTAPAGPTSLTFAFTATNASGASTTKSATIAVTADTLAIANATWDNRRSRGRFTVTASDSVNAGGALGPAGMTVTATFWNATLPSNVPGSAAVPLQLPLALIADPLVCGATIPCWSGLAQAVIQNGAVNVQPTNVVVNSSLGGAAAASGAAITVRQ